MRVKLPFLAPIPIGHDVLVQWTQRPGIFSGWSDAEPIVLDRTTGIVWGDWSVPETLDHAHFAVEQHTQELKQSRPMTAGRVQSCQVTSSGTGKGNHLYTTLVIEVTGELPVGHKGPYR